MSLHERFSCLPIVFINPSVFFSFLSSPLSYQHDLLCSAKCLQFSVSLITPGAPSPPVNLQITDCSHGRTNLSWVPVLSNLTSVTHYLVEQETNHDPTVFDVIYNVTNPNSTSLTLHLPRWSDLRFRVRAVSEVGPSRPSEATAKDVCSTPVGGNNFQMTVGRNNAILIATLSDWLKKPRTSFSANKTKNQKTFHNFAIEQENILLG